MGHLQGWQHWETVVTFWVGGHERHDRVVREAEGVQVGG